MRVVCLSHNAILLDKRLEDRRAVTMGNSLPEHVIPEALGVERIPPQQKRLQAMLDDVSHLLLFRAFVTDLSETTDAV